MEHCPQDAARPGQVEGQEQDIHGYRGGNGIPVGRRDSLSTTGTDSMNDIGELLDILDRIAVALERIADAVDRDAGNENQPE